MDATHTIDVSQVEIPRIAIMEYALNAATIVSSSKNQKEKTMSLEQKQITKNYTGLPEGLDMDTILDAVESDEDLGYCLECGAERGGCEPDAREYECEECNAPAVFGASEILIMFGG